MAWSLYKREAVRRAVYGTPANERHLGPIREEKGIPVVTSLPAYDLSCEKGVPPEIVVWTF